MRQNKKNCLQTWHSRRYATTRQNGAGSGCSPDFAQYGLCITYSYLNKLTHTLRALWYICDQKSIHYAKWLTRCYATCHRNQCIVSGTVIREIFVHKNQLQIWRIEDETKRYSILYFKMHFSKEMFEFRLNVTTICSLWSNRLLVRMGSVNGDPVQWRTYASTGLIKLMPPMPKHNDKMWRKRYAMVLVISSAPQQTVGNTNPLVRVGSRDGLTLVCKILRSKTWWPNACDCHGSARSVAPKTRKKTPWASIH